MVKIGMHISMFVPSQWLVFDLLELEKDSSKASGGILLLTPYMQYKLLIHVNMQLIYVNLQHNYIDM